MPNHSDELPVGSICKLTGLTQHPEANGHFVEILHEAVENEVPERDGVLRRALRYGFENINTGDTGWIKPENLEPQPNITRRAVELHLFGWATEDGGREDIERQRG